MQLDLNHTVLNESKCIDVHQPWNVEKWAKTFNCTPLQLKMAVAAVGEEAEDVKKYLDKVKLSSIFRVLCVEDDTAAREYLVQSLRYYFDEINVASSGEEGLTLFNHLNPDLVISDFRMPRMNGLEMARKIRSVNTKVPVIITSANSNLENLLEAVKSGMIHYLPKPINIDELLKTIKQNHRILKAEKQSDVKMSPKKRGEKKGKK